jgi:nitronate monooxygenase
MKTGEVIATTRESWGPPMTVHEYGAFLNELLEAERAGAKLLSAYQDELPPGSFKWKCIRSVQLDEARNCAVLIHLALEAEATPTSSVGSFYGRGLAINGWGERLRFLNRGQAWVARRLAAAIPRVPESAREVLQKMHDSHVANIESCEALLPGTAAKLASSNAASTTQVSAGAVGE